MKKLSEVTRSLGDAYRAWKTYGEVKDELRQEFFDIATHEISNRVLLQRLENIEAFSEEDARKKAAKKFPRFNVLDVSSNGDGYRVALEEDPKYQSYTYVNKEEEIIFQRQVVEGATYLDEEALKLEDGELWAAITELKRVLRPLDSLSSEQLAQIQKYVYRGKPTVKLLAPRKAKPEELE